MLLRVWQWRTGSLNTPRSPAAITMSRLLRPGCMWIPGGRRWSSGMRTRGPFPPYPLGEEGAGIRWFLGTDVLLRDDEGMVLLARARTEEALDDMRGLVPGDWLNGY